MGRLSGKVAIVTGGSRGIGRAIVEAFMREGASVVLCARTQASVDRVVAVLPSDGGCVGVVQDVADLEAGRRLVEVARQSFGGVDILVNNAGVVSQTGFWDTGPQEWDRVFEVNLRGLFFCTLHVARAMREGRGGSIVNIASIAAQTGGLATGPAYVASKAGVIGLTRLLARQLAPERIRVNALSPADIDTEATAAWQEELRAKLMAITPLSRFGRPEEVAAAAVFLASDEASYITGQVLNVNGGSFMA